MRPELWPEGWDEIQQDAITAWSQDSGATLQVDAEVRALPEASRSSGVEEATAERHRPRVRSRKTAQPVEPDQPPADPEASVSAGLNRWQQMMLRAQARKRWSDKGRPCNYAKNGMPKNIDGKPTDSGVI